MQVDENESVITGINLIQAVIISIGSIEFLGNTCVIIYCMVNNSYYWQYLCNEKNSTNDAILWHLSLYVKGCLFYDMR